LQLLQETAVSPLFLEEPFAKSELISREGWLFITQGRLQLPHGFLKLYPLG
jgi:hypothetical protein